MFGNRRILLLIISLFLIGTADAQKRLTDSLENVIKKHTTVDTIKVNLLNRVAYLLYRNESKKARAYGLQSGKMADKLNYSKGKSNSLWIIGLSHLGQDCKKSYDYFVKSLRISEKSGDKAGVANCMVAIGNVLRDLGEASRGEEYFQKALKVATEIGDKTIIIKCLINIARTKTSKGQYFDASGLLHRAYAIAAELDDKINQSVCYNNLGAIYALQSNYPAAIDYYLKGMRVNEELHNESGVIVNLINIVNIKTDQGNYKGALENAKQALRISEKIADTVKKTICLINIGNIYLKTNDPRALDYLSKALNALKESSVIERIDVLISIGSIYGNKSNYPKAVENYNKALLLANKVGLKRAQGKVWIKIGRVYFEQHQNGKALKCAEKGLAIVNSLPLIELRRDANKLLSEIYASVNDYKKAYYYYVEYKTLNDSSFNEKVVRKISDLENAYKFGKEVKRHELEKQKKDIEIKNQHYIILLLGVAFISMLLLAFTSYRSYRHKKKTNAILVEQKEEIKSQNEEYIVLNDLLQQANEDLRLEKQKVEESEDRLKLLIKNSNDILVLENEKKEPVFISEAVERITGYSVKELLEMGDAVHPDDILLLKQHWEEVLKHGDATHNVQYRHKHKEKGYVWFESAAQNFLDNPMINAVVSNVRDIDERKKAEEALAESESMKRKLLNMEIEKINSELEMNQKSMVAATLKLLQNSERDARTITALDKMQENINPEARQRIGMLINDYRIQSCSTNWQEFEILFEKVHSSFSEKLTEQFPLLTLNERKLCVFLKLNMNNKQIAQITFQSDDALKKARLRLRKKLNLDRDTNLVSFIQNL